MSAATTDEERERGLQLRSCLGRFATGVTIVAAETGAGGTHAMTASAFLSVSLRPALALVSVRTEARMHEHLCGADRFTVSVLTEDQEVPALQFAGQKVLEGISLARHNGLPVVKPALATFVLRHREIVRAGDHHLHIGEIEQAWEGEGEPLVHFSGAFRRLGVTRESSIPSGLAWWADDYPW